MSEKEKNFTEKKSTRRNFLKNSGLTIGGLVIGGAVTSLVVKDKDETVTTSAPLDSEHNHEAVNYNKALMFFTPEQYSTIAAATEQIFPKTEVGPGAEELLVPYFIDHQLAGSYGLMSKEYTKGPFYPNEATPLFGHQSHLTRQDVFVLGINLLNSEATKRFEKKFYELEAEQQIEILTAVEADEVELKASITPSYFFKLLRGATLEGVYSDPLYGGNKDMAGWKMKKFPGHQMSYANMVEKEEFVEIEPQSLTAQHNH